MFKLYKGMFKQLREMQDQLWQQSVKTFPAMALPQDLDGWQRRTLESVGIWAESAVQHSVQLQREWLAQWSGRTVDNKLKPKVFAHLNAEARRSMELWLENQSRLWDQWLEFVKDNVGRDVMPLLEQWDNTIKQSVDTQLALLHDWANLRGAEKLSTKQLAKLTEQIGRSMRKAIETQQQLWNQWFSTSGITTLTWDQDTEKPRVAQVTPKPKDQSKTTRSKVAKQRRAEPGDDNLKRIKGIGPGLEKQLKGAGISTIAQIAALTAKDVAELEAKLIRLSGRIERDQWVAQAKALVGGKA